MRGPGPRADPAAGDATAKARGRKGLPRADGGPPDLYEGYALLDPEGRRIGTVRRVYSGWDDEPEYVRVRTGRFGRRPVLLPVLGVSVDEERETLTLL